jgi:hypothetical protein
MEIMAGTSNRFFSLSNKPNQNLEKETNKDYESSFDDLLSQGKVSEEQKREFQKRREEKAQAVKEAQEKLEADREKSNRAKEQAFDDMLSGKPQITEDMNLQQVFKVFYNRAQTVDHSKLKNSAMGSITGFS